MKLLNRRELLGHAAGFGAAFALPSAAFAASDKRLAYPPLLDATTSRLFQLEARTGETRFDDGAASETFGYNQGYLVPTIRVQAGVETRAEVHNTLGEPMSAHWHGLVVAGEFDGGPHQAIAPGDTWKPVLDLDQPPATAWYHSHIHGATARQVMLGLAGVLQVTDDADDARGLPSAYGVDDLTLVLQDRQFNWRGRLKYDPGMHQSMNGFQGDTMVVNGQIGASAAVPKGIVRCRVVNGSNARVYRLSMSDSRSLHLIATDAGFLDRPIALNRLTLAPGERAEVLVDFTSGRDSVLKSDDIINSAMGGMMGGGGSGSPFTVLPFAVDTTLPVRIDALPGSLDGQLPDLAVKDAPVRRLSLDMSMGMGMMFSRSGNRFSINGASYDSGTLNFSTKLNSIERWIVRGAMMMHPFHVHGVRFQVLSENGTAPRAENRGWKDTVLVDGEVELAMKFEKPASAAAPYMYHCHILEHEDGGMMGQFSVA
ncbi:MAG: multicopper oxidase domain-containing protein [Roseibium sp.]|uniref:multicopper oxidase family protein n=1 Tax=Roseibium sp. TaxID=1936156 RepID=UPI0032653C65